MMKVILAHTLSSSLLIMLLDQTIPALKVSQLPSLTGLPNDISAFLSIEGQPVTLQWFEIIQQLNAALTWNPDTLWRVSWLTLWNKMTYFWKCLLILKQPSCGRCPCLFWVAYSQTWCVFLIKVTKIKHSFSCCNTTIIFSESCWFLEFMFLFHCVLMMCFLQPKDCASLMVFQHRHQFHSCKGIAVEDPALPRWCNRHCAGRTGCVQLVLFMEKKNRPALKDVPRCFHVTQ